MSRVCQHLSVMPIEQAVGYLLYLQSPLLVDVYQFLQVGKQELTVEVVRLQASLQHFYQFCCLIVLSHLKHLRFLASSAGDL